ncbi:hypothetical protein ACIBCN_39765 [Nocardia sp. NPDC051052]|uniref:hypothetical protein n=1 Tax=Nocardia sp. NPDC051052 TaxID=3364322 RepID=UPI00379A9F72
MDFDVASFNEIIKKLEGYVDDIGKQISTGIPNARSTALDVDWVDWTPGLVSVIKKCAEKMIEGCKWIWDKIVDILKSAWAPVTMFTRALDWYDVKGTASGVQSTLDPNNLEAIRLWKGAAQVSYMRTATTQSAAAGKVADAGDKTALVLVTAAASGLTFYAGMALITYQFIAACVAEIGLLCTGFGAPLSLAGFLADAGITTAAIWGAVAGIATLVGGQATAFANINSTVSDNSGFPQGADGKKHWPESFANSFSDASVDGDKESKWRLN